MANNNTQPDNILSVITPRSPLNNNNMSISQQDDSDLKIKFVKYDSNDQYVLMHKDGSVPDITLDKATVDLIIEARKMEQSANDLVKYVTSCKTKYDIKMLSDKKVVSEILTKYANENKKTQGWIIKPSLEWAIRNCTNAQKYIL